MSAASIQLKLKHTCTILRDANAATTNPRGNQNPPNWQPHATLVPCFYWTASGREQAADADQIVNVETQRLVLALNTDISKDDMVSAIVDEYGATTVAGPIQIHAVLHNLDHIEAVLVSIG